MKKILLMGHQGAGKTSMHSIIFSHYRPYDTHKIGYTIKKQEHRYKFMGLFTLNLWDCGGQDQFMQEFLFTHKQSIFKQTQILIYVFDAVGKVEEDKKIYNYWQKTLQNIKTYSKNARIFVLINKVDQLSSNHSNILQKSNEIKQMADQQKVQITKIFLTTIYNESLYHAWSEIAQSLIINPEYIKTSLSKLCEFSQCSDAIIFQKKSCLILSHYSSSKEGQIQKFQILSTLIKLFKLTCARAKANIQEIKISLPRFTGFITDFTKTESIFIFNKNDDAKNMGFNQNSSIISINISNLGKAFARYKNEEMRRIQEQG